MTAIDGTPRELLAASIRFADNDRVSSSSNPQFLVVEQAKENTPENPSIIRLITVRVDGIIIGAFHRATTQTSPGNVCKEFLLFWPSFT